jgi:hypothetical protein
VTSPPVPSASADFHGAITGTREVTGTWPVADGASAATNITIATTNCPTRIDPSLADADDASAVLDGERAPAVPDRGGGPLSRTPSRSYPGL